MFSFPDRRRQSRGSHATRARPVRETPAPVPRRAIDARFAARGVQAPRRDRPFGPPAHTRDACPIALNTPTQSRRLAGCSSDRFSVFSFPPERRRLSNASVGTNSVKVCLWRASRACSRGTRLHPARAGARPLRSSPQIIANRPQVIADRPQLVTNGHGAVAKRAPVVAKRRPAVANGPADYKSSPPDPILSPAAWAAASGPQAAASGPRAIASAPQAAANGPRCQRSPSR